MKPFITSTYLITCQLLNLNVIPILLASLLLLLPVDMKSINPSSNIENPANFGLKSVHKRASGSVSTSFEAGRLSPIVSRSKRNLLQLGRSVMQNTRYSLVKLSNYGNWCGRGGNRSGDGSTVDGCDLCCKTHDECYRHTRMKFPGCHPPTTTYEQKSESQEHQDNHCPEAENDGCEKATCECDVHFVRCMHKEPCPPLKVYESVSYLWWLG